MRWDTPSFPPYMREEKDTIVTTWWHWALLFSDKHFGCSGYLAWLPGWDGNSRCLESHLGSPDIYSPHKISYFRFFVTYDIIHSYISWWFGLSQRWHKWICNISNKTGTGLLPAQFLPNLGGILLYTRYVEAQFCDRYCLIEYRSLAPTASGYQFHLSIYPPSYIPFGTGRASPFYRIVSTWKRLSTPGYHTLLYAFTLLRKWMEGEGR